MRPIDNPYNTKRLESIPFIFQEGWNWNRMLKTLENKNYLGVIIGNHGTGKTTLLLELKKRALRSEREIIFIDEFGALSFLQKIKILLRAIFYRKNLLLTAHKPIVFIPTIYNCKTTHEIIQGIATYLEQDEVCQCRQENVRDFLLEKYDKYAKVA